MTLFKTLQTAVMEGMSVSEEELIDGLFFNCDENREGKAYVSSIIQYVRNFLENGHVSYRFDSN